MTDNLISEPDDPWPPAFHDTPPESDETAPRETQRQLALKHGDTFLVCDPFGDIIGDSDGLFDNDTRVLSRFRLRLGGKPPSLLAASVSQDNVVFTANLTNRPLPPLGGKPMPEGVIHVERTRFLWAHRMFERISLVNYAQREALVPLSLLFEADFRDMFEVRGQHRPVRGRVRKPVVNGERVCLSYEGLDGVVRDSILAFSETPVSLLAQRADFMIRLEHDARHDIFLEIGPHAQTPSRDRFRKANARAKWSMRAKRRRGASLDTSSRLFNEWIDKSAADLALLTTDLPTGPYPYAGIPWFSTPFGRDAVVTALQTCWLDPTLSRGVLTFLARNQARETSSFQDSAPGKIVHEMRRGEMTSLGELPFGQYYGGVDTTPLFLILAGTYADRTGDLAFIEELWPALTAALEWVEGAGDSNADGFLDYARGAETGLANQGWKDSFDSIFDEHGQFPEGPIALVEVQGYVYAALRGLSRLAARRGDPEHALDWSERAEQLREKVERRFWMEKSGSYGIALDGKGKLCRVRASNAGHLLFSGLPVPERAARVTRLLSASTFNSGWGIRTLADAAPRYNPMSYHNGSVWPHDTGICVAGMARYGERDEVVRVMGDMFESAVQFGMRLPELFCGFPRSRGEAPIAYPVACLPQAWAAGSVFMMLQSCLGLTIDGWNGEIHVDRPALPRGVERLRLRRLQIGEHQVGISFQRVGDRVVCLPEEGSRAVVKIVASL